MGLFYIREHAQKIRTLLEMPGFERGEFRIWRALYWTHGEYLAACISQHKTGEIRAIVQRRYGRVSGAQQNAREGITDPYIQAEEIAVFLGLDDIEPDSLHWVEQRVGAKLLK